MTKFKDLITANSSNKEMDDASVSLTLEAHTLFLRFDSKDIILRANYSGPASPWLSALCALLIEKTLTQALHFNWNTFEAAFKDDQTFWDFRQETQDDFFCKPLELLKATLDLFRGKEYLYQETSPLVCRCFGIRESDVLEHLQKNEVPTLESLSGETKAGMGCRSCVPQLNRWLVLHESKKHSHHYKDRPVAEWLLDIDYMLSCFPESQDWKMEVKSMKGKQVQISFEKEVTQREEEAIAKKLQDFLGAAVDGDLGFFLRRARHFSKARG